MLTNHAKGAMLFASIYIIVFLLSAGLFISKQALIQSSPGVANAVITTPTATRSSSNIYILTAELVAISVIAIAEMRYKVLSRIYNFISIYLKKLGKLPTLIFEIAIFIGIWWLILKQFGSIDFVLISVNGGGMAISYLLFLHRKPLKKTIPVYVTFLAFFILWPFAILFAGHNLILLLFAEFGYIPLTFFISVFVMRNPTKNRINAIAFMFSIALPPVLGTLFLPAYAITLLGIFAAYDFIAVFLTHHMQYMAKSLLGLGIPEAFLFGDFGEIKQKLASIDKNDVKKSISERIVIEDKPLIFGVGDAVLPGVVISSFALVGNIPFAMAAAVGAIIGVMANLKVLRMKRHTLPALPLIFIAMIVIILLAAWA